MRKDVEFTETYRETLSVKVSIIEKVWGDQYVNQFFDAIDDAVQ
ncbi:hypothetical protein [Membranihabitans maritimus]|nr:hypothetical protein [Membranihabitans maritimus]